MIKVHVEVFILVLLLPVVIDIFWTQEPGWAACAGLAAGTCGGEIEWKEKLFSLRASRRGRLGLATWARGLGDLVTCRLRLLAGRGE